MIVIVTGSIRKKQEISQFIDNRILYRCEAIDLEEIQGSSEEIVRKKLKEAYKAIQGPVAVEDYSLYIDALCGMPGPYIKWYLKEDTLNKIVTNLHSIADVRCTEECIYGYCDEFGETHIFKGTSQGILRPTEEKVEPLFSVDQLLIPDGSSQRYMLLKGEDKLKYSVRKKAIELLVAHVNSKKTQVEHPAIEEANISTEQPQSINISTKSDISK
ncbi:inosine triphosphate pyrophosphatase [Nematocida sp. LUAm3]|nr:inosine triphosphate pyrophosphatase [Nematocida sp. LUAm3]KAI5173792.1 inosine triphosphate pyrophosphatase [Nematocida sp. LUAm2]KAI5177015.1 inosine triphosphate pyrophosphatase [Nematocida sp. LUAm1]